MEEMKIITAVNMMYPAMYIDGHHNHEAFISRTTNFLDQMPKELLKNSLVSYAILLLSMFKEEILEKTETKEIILNIPDEHLETLLGNLVQPDGEKFVIGDLTFEDKKEILEVLRNKLLHGDYYLEGDKVVIIRDGYEGYIEANDLIKMCSLFIPVLYFKKTGPQYRPITLFKDPHGLNIEDITTPKALKRLMKDVKFYNFKDEPEPGYERTNDYALTLASFFDELNCNDELKRKYSLENYVNVIFNKYKPLFKKHHITLQYEGKSVSDIPEFQQLKEFFITNYHEFENYPPLAKRDLLIHQASDFLQKEGCDHLITSGAIINDMLYLIAYLKEERLNISKMHTAQSNMFPDDMTIANGFNVFYSMYHYELDELYSKGKETRLEDVLKAKYLNFAVLDLSPFDTPSMEIETKFQDFMPQLNSMLTESPKKEASMKRVKQNYLNYIQKEDKEEEREAKIKAAYEKAKNDYRSHLALTNAGCRFMAEDFDKYVRNFNIISHIRNAFAHGNVRILPHVKGDPLLDRKIVISDIYEGKDTYSITVTYRDFRKSFEGTNLKYIMLFLNEKMMSIPGMREKLEESLRNPVSNGISFIKKDKK